jgi:CDP-glucose 4,6-dehydratase
VDLLTDLSKRWGFTDPAKAYQVTGNITFYEASLLKLNCDKSLHYLGWHAVMDFDETVRMTAQWYKAFYQKTTNISGVTNEQIAAYTANARRDGLVWAQ